MKRFVWSLYIILTATLAVATLAEHSQGTAFVSKHIYHSPAFCIGWGLLVLSALYVFCRRRMWLNLPSLLLHVSFVVILSGALTSFLTSVKGHVHLRAGIPVAQFVEQETNLVRDLPFSLTLNSFDIVYYPGTDAPSDYVSRIGCTLLGHEDTLSAEISMNKVFDCRGYRFYQSSYDEDGNGSWLSVNYDPLGTAVTYTGYMMLPLSMLAVLFRRRGHFRRLLGHPLLRSGGMCLLFMLASGGLPATAKNLYVIPEAEADSLGRTQVVYNGRVAPFNTLARDFVKKLSGNDSFGGLSAEQIVGSWMKRPEEWKNVPIIKIKSAELRGLLGIESSVFARLADLADGEQYLLRELLKKDKQKSGKPSALEKAILETDEKVALVLMLCNGALVKPMPADGSAKPLSEAEINAELLYNSIPFSKILFMFNLAFGFMSFGCLLWSALRKRQMAMSVVSKWRRWCLVALWASLLFHAFGYGLRWYIGGRIPLSNGYETMQFMALCVLVLSIMLRSRFSFVVPFGFLLSGFALLVSYLGQMNPQITPLMPVLVSPWLSSHVSFIMVSYSLFAFIWLNGLLGMCVPREAERLMLFSRLLLYPAVFFLGAGIFIGAVWANVSWGRYWAWDPKEVWALVTFMIYALPFHADTISWLRNPKFFHLYMLAAFLTVLMTYFGVNYLLGGMHSYA